MNMKRILTIGCCLSIMAAVGVVNAVESSAADARRVDVIGTLNERVVQSDSMTTGGESMRVDIIGNIGAQGPVYPYAQPINR